jgi:hypothetical protein
MQFPENDPLDEEFPLGDGLADTDATIACPYCGESGEIALDPGSGQTQEYIEDCQVCCQPLQISVRYVADGSADVQVRGMDE